MSQNANAATAEKSASGSNGCFLIGKALGDSEMVKGTSKSGKPFILIKTQVIAGRQVAFATQFVGDADKPLMYRDGDVVSFRVVPGLEDKNVLNLDVIPA